MANVCVWPWYRGQLECLLYVVASVLAKITLNRNYGRVPMLALGGRQKGIPMGSRGETRRRRKEEEGRGLINEAAQGGEKNRTAVGIGSWRRRQDKIVSKRRDGTRCQLKVG